MIGGGVFIFTGIVFRVIEPVLPVAYALAVIPVFISMMPMAMLGSAIPSSGANYRYPSRRVSPGPACVGIWVYASASCFGQIPQISGPGPEAAVYRPGQIPDPGPVWYWHTYNTVDLSAHAKVVDFRNLPEPLQTFIEQKPVEW